MYSIYTHPLLEYGSVIFDSCAKYLVNTLENMQRHALITITRCYRRTSNQKLLNILGLETLAKRREKAKLVLFYKIFRGLTPSYMKTLLPTSIDSNTYNLRNSANIRPYFTRKEYFIKSYIPSTISLWINYQMKLDNRRL